MKGRRVALTGFGCVTPIGASREAFAEGLREARSGVDRISLFDPEGLPVTIAAEVKGFDPTETLPPRELRHVARVVPLSLAVVTADSPLSPRPRRVRAEKKGKKTKR